MSSGQKVLKRSFTRNHTLLPAHGDFAHRRRHPGPTYTQVAQWTFGRGSVIRRIWLSVLFHTLLAAAVVSLSLTTSFQLAIPSVLLTVLGVVIGFVISYRAMSGYDRYFMGRTAWADVIKNARTFGRLIWHHVPPCLTPQTENEKLSGWLSRSSQELERVMEEKKMALDLIEGFAVALKHHMRGEPGMFYEDLYDLLTPLHDHRHSVERSAFSASTPSLGLGESSTGNTPHETPLSPTSKPRDVDSKYHPVVASHGKNLPLIILQCLSEWLSVLEDRGTVPGTSLGSMIGSIAGFEDALTTLEKILTTPLPFVYSVHIKHTVWIYLFFLPFQLVTLFRWYSIPGVAIAAFIYLGFIAAGEEIEQPFGYDENDLDLDLFCREIIHLDIERLKTSVSSNAYLGKDKGHFKERSMTLVEATAAELEDGDSEEQEHD